MEDKPARGDCRLELFYQVPADGLSLAVFICGEIELVNLRQHFFEFGDVLLFFPGLDDVQGGEVVFDVDAGNVAAVLILKLGGYVLGGAGKIPDVSDTGFDQVVVVQESGQSFCLGWRFDYDESFRHLMLLWPPP